MCRVCRKKYAEKEIFKKYIPEIQVKGRKCVQLYVCFLWHLYFKQNVWIWIWMTMQKNLVC